ncbi:MAG: hypothetical protein VR67_03105 [Peptococcaceae bacterium BRH_c8a]|nr:MAG: hypothetical protein VR67_03105 [Peptococcaceae bacterium BRH_c8a]
MLKIEALVLAAGFSSRMPGNKLLLDLNGQKLIHHTLKAVMASKVSGVTVVLGHQKEKLRYELANDKLNLIDNDKYHLGMSTSVKAGIIYLLANKQNMDAVMIMPGDIPLIKTETINQLLQVYNTTASSIVVPVHQERRGHPVMFDKSLFQDLLLITGDTGAKGVLQKHAQRVNRVFVNDPGIYSDIDTWEDYRVYCNHALSGD